MLDTIEMMSFAMQLILIYSLMFIILLGRRYLRSYQKIQKLKFTREEVKEVRLEIAPLKKIYKEIKPRSFYDYFDEEIPDYVIDESIECVEDILRIYNDLAFGIREGLFDESYIRNALGADMMYFYTEYDSLINISYRQSSFIPLEFLLKSWGNVEQSKYKPRDL